MPADRGAGDLGQAILDALPDRMAVLDADGVVLAVNTRWRDLELGSELRSVSVGVGDLASKVLRDAVTIPAVFSQGFSRIAAAIDAVLAGREREVSVEMPSPAGAGRWDLVRVTRLPVGGVLMAASDVSEIVLTQARLTHATTHDPITGLPNRGLLVERLQGTLDRHHRGAVGVIHLDLDRFGLLNATYGPMAGDRVLGIVARRLTSGLLGGEQAARVGDDSFAIVTDEVGRPDELADHAERLLARVREPMHLDGQEIVVKASAGVVVAGPGERVADDVLRDAEVAMTEAKEAGRDRVALAGEEQRSASVHRHEIEQALAHAVNRDELWLEYQPEVSLSTGRIVGAEALLRWRHPRLGVLNPSAFIGVAEQTGVINEMGAWVLHTACRDAAAWELPADDRADVYVAVNISPVQLADADVPHLVEQSLGQAGLPARRLCLEVTESALFANWDVAVVTLRRLQAIGVRVAIDDFGTGFASFDHLLRLPADIVKLDRSLVARVGEDPASLAVVESIVSLARRLDIQVVAEGVERADIRDALAAAGCDVIQGYQTGRPGSITDLVGAVWSTPF